MIVVTEEGALQGILSRGENGTFAIQDGQTMHRSIEVPSGICEELAHHTFQYVRLNGTGQWFHYGGAWRLHHFAVRDFAVLSDTPLTEIVGKLRAVPGNRWSESPDPIGEILSLRED